MIVAHTREGRIPPRPPMLRTLLVIAILVPGIVWAIRDRYGALVVYLWFALFRPQDWLWFDISALRLSMTLGVLLVVPATLTGVWPNLTHPLSVGSILFLLSALVAHTNAVNAAVSFEWLDFLARLILVSLIGVTLMNTPRRVLGVMAVIAGSLGFHAAKAGLFSIMQGGVRFADGLSGAFIDNNGYALAIVMIMPFLFALGQTMDLIFAGRAPRLERWCRLGAFAAIPLCGMATISTFSRAGFLAIVAVGFAYMVIARGQARLALFAAGILTASVVWFSLPEGYLDRISTIQTYEQVDDQSSLGRLHFWQVAIDMADAVPLGVGLRNFDYAYDRYDSSNGMFGTQRAVHSSHLEVLAEQGYGGFLVWMLQFLVAFVIAFRLRIRANTPGLSPDSSRFLVAVANAVMVSMIGFFVGGSFIALALNDVTWLTFAMLAAADRVSLELCEAAAREPYSPPTGASDEIESDPSDWEPALPPDDGEHRPRFVFFPEPTEQ